MLQSRNQTAVLLVDYAFPVHVWSQVKHQVDDGLLLLLFFFTLREFFTGSFFLQAKWLNGVTTRIFCNVWGCKSAEDVQNNGRTRTGWFNITLHWCTVLCQCSSFWLPKIWLCSPTLLTRLICLLVVSSFVNEIKATGSSFQGYIWNSGTVADHP